jgi:hypothetical protein
MIPDSLLTILTPITTGFLSSFHLSLPLLICYRRFLYQGRRAGAIASIGTVIGQITFISFFTILGSRSFISFWYVGEPLLHLLGLSLVFRVLISYRRPFLNWRLAARTTFWTPRESNWKDFFTSFFLPWLIPAGFGDNSMSRSFDLLLDIGPNWTQSVPLFYGTMLPTILIVGFGSFFFYQFYWYHHRFAASVLTFMTIGFTLATMINISYRFFFLYVPDLPVWTRLSHAISKPIPLPSLPGYESSEFKTYRFHNRTRRDQEYLLPLMNDYSFGRDRLEKKMLERKMKWKFSLEDRRRQIFLFENQSTTQTVQTLDKNYMRPSINWSKFHQSAVPSPKPGFEYVSF